MEEVAVHAALALGFVRAGVASVEAFPHQEQRLENFVKHGHHGGLHYLDARSEEGRLLRADPHFVFPEARSAICVALAYPAPLAPGSTPSHGEGTEPTASVAAYAHGADYHLVMREKLLVLGDSLAALWGLPFTSRICVDTAPLLERDLAVRSGFAFIGKNTLAIAPGAGSHFVLGELLLDIPIAHTVSTIQEGCGSCTACLDACPTDAFIAPYQMDARRCISYFTIESRDDIPEPLRSPMGDRVFGCDICQSVCPYNRAGRKRPIDPSMKPRPELRTLQLIAQLQLTSGAYKRFVKGSAMRRVSRNQLARNAAIALGNSGSPAAVAPLLHAAECHHAEQVRTHATWALKELATTHELPQAVDAMVQLEKSQSQLVPQGDAPAD